jgi:predicted RNA binding protein YcfA (HicA-like mRNA interferase family)
MLLVAKKYREVRATLRKAGWIVARVSGSHEIWTHPDGRSVVVQAAVRTIARCPPVRWRASAETRD